MAVKNRPVVGVVNCPYCDGTRSVHQYESGRHSGKLYSRCPSCEQGSGHRFESKTSKAEQTLLRSKTQFRPEFVHLAEVETPKPQPATPPTPDKTEAVADLEKPQTPKETPNPKLRKGSGAALVAGLFGLILIAAGVAAK